MRKFFIYILIALMPLALVACGDKGADKPQVKRARGAKKAVAKSAAPATAAASKKEASKDVLASGPRRNPFKSFVVQAGPEDDGRIRGPLECCELGLFKILAIVSASGKSRALVRAPDGKRYIVQVGDVMGTREGKVVDITSEKVVVVEVTKNPRGEISSKESIELALPTYEQRKASKKR